MELGFNIITVHHWDRLLGGVLLATSPRVPWAMLLRRTFEMDVTRCPRCLGRMRMLSVITQRATIQKILDHLGLPADPPTVKPGRSPTWNEDPPIWADG